MIDPAWISHPDEVDDLIGEWAAAYPGLLRAEHKMQFAGRPVWALSVTDNSIPDEGKRKAMVFKPHAHEPAPIAAQMNVISQLLTGQTIDGHPSEFDNQRVLRECLLVFMPDANPEGTARAPVEAWDGSEYTNDEFWAWMRGIDPETGKMWKRVDLWDDTIEDPLPTRYGIVYEQISEHEYVEPNRHHASTLFRWIFEMMDRHADWHAMLSLHQTEFETCDDTCMIILPCLYDDLPEDIKREAMAWAEDVVAGWGEVEGAHPRQEIAPLNYGGEQRQYFVERWGDIYPRVPIITSEIQNNNAKTPPALQQRLNEVAIRATIDRLLG